MSVKAFTILVISSRVKLLITSDIRNSFSAFSRSSVSMDFFIS